MTNRLCKQDLQKSLSKAFVYTVLFIQVLYCIYLNVCLAREIGSPIVVRDMKTKQMQSRKDQPGSSDQKISEGTRNAKMNRNVPNTARCISRIWGTQTKTGLECEDEQERAQHCQEHQLNHDGVPILFFTENNYL